MNPTNPRFAGPGRTVTARNGVVGRVDRSGQITSIRGNGITINRGAGGQRTIISQRSDHTRVVSFGSGRGFVDRPLIRNGRPYLQRTYVVNGRAYASVYRGSYYRGVVYYRYVPPFYFAPAFYGWAYRPWGLRVSFNWGWGPWFGFYGYYFNPYPYYVGPSPWLTDYIISQQLQDAYNAGYNAGQQSQPSAQPPPPDQSSYAPLSPELKQAIADEVSAQLAAQNNAASSNTQAAPPAAGAAPTDNVAPDALDPKTRTFIVSTPLAEQLSNGAECPLGSGDVLTRIDDTPDANQNVQVLVSSSQANDCPSGSQLSVGVQDLQDMYNSFREKMDAGLNQLAQNQGKNGIPAAPAATPMPNADGTAQPDSSAQADLQQQQQQAQAAEQDVQSAQQ